MRQLVEKENSEFKPVKLRLKIDLVSYPARAEGLVNSKSVFVESLIKLNAACTKVIILHSVYLD